MIHCPAGLSGWILKLDFFPVCFLILQENLGAVFNTMASPPSRAA